MNKHERNTVLFVTEEFIGTKTFDKQLDILKGQFTFSIYESHWHVSGLGWKDDERTILVSVQLLEHIKRVRESTYALYCHPDGVVTDGTFDEPLTMHMYQIHARRTAIYPNKGSNLTYTVLGLVGEAGEVANRAAKIIRDEDQKMTVKARYDLEKELGDVLWFIAVTCDELGLDMGEVAQENLNKLLRRQEMDTIKDIGRSEDE